MKLEVTEEVVRTITVASCIKCGGDEIEIVDYGYSSPNIGGGKCVACGHEVTSGCDINPDKQKLVAIWNAKNDISSLLTAKRDQVARLNKEIAELEQREKPKGKELADCPECGSSDVGGSNNMVYCYTCQHEVRAETTAEAVEKWNALSGDPTA